MDIKSVQQINEVIDSLVSISQELLIFGNLFHCEEFIYGLTMRIKLLIGTLSKIIENEPPKEQKGKYRGPLSWILNRI